MLGWVFAGALYVIGVVGLNAMSRDCSTVPRRVRTYVNIVFWPVVVPFAFVGDCYDYFRGE